MIPDNANRERVLKLVRDGDASPQEAEEWASRCNQPPFAAVPELKELNPMSDPLWTMPMAMAWFIWRTEGAVIESMDEYCRKVKKWDTVPPDNDYTVLGNNIWDLVELERPSISELLRHPDVAGLPTDNLFDPTTWDPDEKTGPGASSPYRRFIEAVELGQITASAISSANGKRDGLRAPFPFLIQYLRSGLRSKPKAHSPKRHGHQKINERRRSILPEYESDGVSYSAILVPREQVIDADALASKLECEWAS